MKKIEKFILPEHTNTLYEKEAISSISLAKEVADKINELVDVYNSFAGTDLAWKQEQEGTIRKAIVYIKDNLLNTLRELTEIYEKNGLFDSYVNKYTKELETRLNNLLTGATTDGEIIDMRVGGDGVAYETAGAAMRGQFKKLSDIIKAYSKQNMKPEEKTPIFIDTLGYFTAGGTFTKAEHYQTALFDCEIGDVFAVYNTQIGTAACRVALLDENKKFICALETGTGYIKDVYDTTEYTILVERARYFAVAVYHQALDFKVKKYVALSGSMQKSINDIESAVFKTVDNPINIETHGNYYIDVAGEIVASSTYFCSKAITVNAGEKYHVKSSNVGTAAYLYALYDETGAICGIGTRGTGSTNSATEDYYIIIPDGASSIRFCWHEPKNSIAVYKVDKIAVFDNSAAKNHLHGKVLIGLGDSLMCDVYTGAGNEWLSLIGRRNNMTVHNYALSGNPMSVNADCMAVRYANMVDADEPYIIVMGGANDRNIAAPIGSNSDNTIATFKGALNVLIKGLIAKYPKAKIVFCTNYKRYGLADEKAYVDAMLEICALHCIPCHNNYIASGCHFDNKEWMSIFGADTSNFENKHLNAAGDERVSTMYENLLLSL